MPVKKSIYVFILLALISTNAAGQNEYVKERKPVYGPIWSYHQRNINIYGVSVGVASLNNRKRYTNTNGIKLELIGAGLFLALIPASPIAANDSAFQAEKKELRSEIINGINLSAIGTTCDCTTNGIVAGAFGHYNYKVNGISVAAYLSFVQIHNGIQIAMWNETYVTRGIQLGIVHNEATKLIGLQIGIINEAKNLKGLQIGIWNKSGKRKLPLLNWGF